MLEGVIKVNANKFDEETNPNGIINLGVAENQLMKAELREIVSLALNNSQDKMSSILTRLPFPFHNPNRWERSTTSIPR